MFFLYAYIKKVKGGGEGGAYSRVGLVWYFGLQSEHLLLGGGHLLESELQ